VDPGSAEHRFRKIMAADTRNRDKIFCGGKLRVEIGVDSVGYFLLGIASVHCVRLLLPLSESRARQYTPP
jgi:hypothetical protein